MHRVVVTATEKIKTPFCFEFLINTTTSSIEHLDIYLLRGDSVK